jgi:thiamine-phosphate pyrophosphorylase
VRASPPDLRLYVLLDAGRAERAALPALARAAVDGGATLLQYRDKRAETRTLVETARAIRSAVDGAVPLLINDRVDVALAAGADGVHVGQDDMAAEDARRLLGPLAIIGISLSRDAHVAAIAEAPVDYACVSAVFATSSKDDAKALIEALIEAPIGLIGFARLAAMVRKARPQLPVGAISGIDMRNAASVIGAGADGVAVISAITDAPDPKAATHELRTIVDRSLAARGAGASPGESR